MLAFASADVNCNVSSTNPSVSLYHTLTTNSAAAANTSSYSLGSYYYQNASDNYFPATNLGRFAATAGVALTVYWRAGLSFPTTEADSCYLYRPKISLLFIPD